MSIAIVTVPDDAGKRLDAVLKTAMPDFSRAQLQKAIKSGACQVDGKEAGDPAMRLRAGQNIALDMPQKSSKLEPSQNNLEILWRDEHMAVLVKPAGLTVHPCPSCRSETLAHRLVAHFPELADQESERPGIVHRLDKDTSGLMIIALTGLAQLKLAKAFADRRIRKQYLALASGSPANAGECHAPLGRHPSIKTRMAAVAASHGGREAHTTWKTLWQGRDIALLAVRIMTGRTHQIRVHLAHMGLPIIGDAVYAPSRIAAMAPRQMLHAWRIDLAHPVTGEPLRFCAPPPSDFFEAALANCRHMRRIVVTGNQGCGKSSFCRFLAANGMPTISADDIVAGLYSRKSPATEWIGAHLGDEALKPGGAVDKGALFKILCERPGMRHELEKAVHGLTLAEIECFWQKKENAGANAACAEIPLYFESGFSALMNPKPYVVGISCAQTERWARLAANRGWSEAKIREIEGWQWPEARKMGACNRVVANNGTPHDLENRANAFLHELDVSMEEEEKQLREKLQTLCDCPAARQDSARLADVWRR